jgi:glucosylceramidase
VDYLKPALDATPYGTKIWFGALTNYTTFNAYWSSLTDLSAISGVSLHAATQSGIAEVKAQGLLVMQTQHPAGNYPFLSTQATSREDADRDNFLAEMAPNNHAYGEESWDHIKSWIDDGANIYSTWNMVLDNLGFNLDEVRPWPQNALITVDTEAKSYEITPYYYVLRHLSRYVDVGATVLFVSGDVLAFQNPDGSFVVVVFNRETDAVTHTLDLDGTLLEFGVPARGWVTVNWAG